MASFAFNYFKGITGYDWENDDIRALLVTATPDRDAQFVNDASITELTTAVTTSYARVNITGRSINVNTTLDRAEFLSDDIDFGALETGETVLGAIVFKFVTDDSDSLVIGFLEIANAAERATNGEVFKMQNTDGHVYVAL